jgi:hypothetical protein
MKKIIPYLFVAVLAVSCEKEISVDLPDPESLIVVDGGISVGETAAVTLTWSAGYFDPIDSASLANYVITDALVTVTDGITTDTLTLSVDFNRPIPVVWIGSDVLGQVGRTYTLTVVADGKRVTSSTTIPTPVPLDSVWFEPEIPGDSLGFAWAHLTDPVGYGNGYRWYTMRLNEDPTFMAPYGSTFDDNFIEGQSFDFGYSRPVASNSQAPEDNDFRRGYFITGDTIVVKFCSIGIAEANFFRTYEIEVSNNGNPFASPGVIESNVTDGLGVFCGYSPTYDTIICQ